MNIALRKLAMLEKSLQEKEMQARMEGLSTSPIDKDFQARITNLMDKVRLI